MNPVSSFLKYHFFPSLEDHWDVVAHVLAGELKSSNGFDEVLVFTEATHHASFFKKAVLIWTHQDVLEAKHSSYMTVEQSLVLVNIIAHLRQNLRLNRPITFPPFRELFTVSFL